MEFREIFRVVAKWIDYNRYKILWQSLENWLTGYQKANFYFGPSLTVGGGGPRVVVSTAAFHARVRGSVPGLGGLKETKMFLPHPRVKVSIVGSLRDREVACSASDSQGSNFESCVWRTVSSQSSHHPQEVLLAQFRLYVHKGGLKPDSFHFYLYQNYQNRLNVDCRFNSIWNTIIHCAVIIICGQICYFAFPDKIYMNFR